MTHELRFHVPKLGTARENELRPAHLPRRRDQQPDPAANAGAMSMTIQDGTISGISWFDPELGITIDTTATLTRKSPDRAGTHEHDPVEGDSVIDEIPGQTSARNVP